MLIYQDNAKDKRVWSTLQVMETEFLKSFKHLFSYMILQLQKGNVLGLNRLYIIMSQWCIGWHASLGLRGSGFDPLLGQLIKQF